MAQNPKDAVEDTPIVNTGDAARLVREHRPDDTPFIAGECIPHDSRLQFGSLNHVHSHALNTEHAFRSQANF